MGRFLVALLGLSAACAGGCNILAYPMALFAPPAPMKTVEPEYDGLKGRTVALVVFAGPETELDYQQVQIEMHDVVSAELKKHVKDARVVDVRRVMRYQDENPRWDAEPPEKLCKVFDCDAVLLIALEEFSTRERGSIHLARGRIRAGASVYVPDRRAAGGQKGGCAWRSGTVNVVYPPKSPLGLPAGNDRPLRIRTEWIFAERLVKSFYKHKVPKEP